MIKFKIIQCCTNDEIIEYIRVSHDQIYEKFKLDEYMRDPNAVIHTIIQKCSLILKTNEIQHLIVEAINDYDADMLSRRMISQMDF